MSAEPRYRGRFAPSPTGPLHIGSLMAAVGSYLEARCHNGDWLVRMEDLDLPRCLPGAADLILTTLEKLGFEWEGDVIYQSRRTAHYEAALAELRDKQLIYPCACTRKEIAAIAHAGIDGPVYPGTCRHGIAAGKSARAWRLRVPADPWRFEDALQGPQQQQLEWAVGDFVLKRSDGLFAYQLAVVVDDAAQGVTDIVRGADLLDSTPRQLYLQNCLNLPTPRYMHLPIAVNPAGEKLSKQTLAPALDLKKGVRELWRALQLLGQQPPSELAGAGTREFWDWAMQHWQRHSVPHARSVPANTSR